ncbi:hypothetical protein DSCO28_30770 [Desulfosarcina ovata subsp. sediminis]|uniref:Poly(3-hydroxyalkanoate) polymerase subunit PhaE n=1 Tax=Desulfosarcina ovata subsp. sediminis TaxID=885957 RepID=A0A5K7ZN10_9BACT|nr:poly(R)-hydroxyalkanoic acid synthase subunit PhaE [Desulfosarcina ovata]BBO82511.1 hypothetical protein DSCO28_30770 [Desulfosarcina ovata subsp. sediminis]
MENKDQDPFGMMAMVNAWLKPMGELWEDMAKRSDSARKPPESQTKNSGKAPPNAQASLVAALKNCQAMASAMATPESVNAILKGSGEMPEVLLKLFQSYLGSYMQVQQNLINSIGRLGASVEAYRFEDIDENLCRLWTDIYEGEFRRYFQIPQLGLLRSYQEKANQLADQYNLLQAQLAEFLRMLSLPFSHAMQVMQEKLGELAEKGELSDDTHEYYNLWIKVLEGHFMTLFQTPEYVEALNRTVNALADFTAARDAVAEDLLSLVPVARKSEVDDMAREIFELKKRLKKIEKDNNRG